MIKASYAFYRKDGSFMFSKVYEVWVEPFKDVNPLPELVKSVQDVIAMLEENWSCSERGELLFEGIDGDIVNEYCHMDPELWDEMDEYYEALTGGLSFDDADLVAIKKERAECLFADLDPGFLEDTMEKLGIYYEEASAGTSEDYMPSYEEWRAGLTIGELEFPHNLYSGHPHEYVRRLVEEKNMMEEVEMAMTDDLYS
jgi:hypothetical protein